ncbi:MAG TPA: DnaJ domain-containing protein, partial [Nitrospinaceae bacterium]|nr:DnaJ domain-containing protein [Nitrospinaceae bacterium]
MRTQFREFKDYYKVLGISDAAVEKDIKKAYRKLALEHHPDHNKNAPDSEEKFKQITEAYGVLIDPLKRSQYDRFRTDYLAGRTDESSQFGYSQQDIFEEMFRNGFGKDIFEELNREFSRSG